MNLTWLRLSYVDLMTATIQFTMVLEKHNNSSTPKTIMSYGIHRMPHATIFANAMRASDFCFYCPDEGSVMFEWRTTAYEIYTHDRTLLRDVRKKRRKNEEDEDALIGTASHVWEKSVNMEKGKNPFG